MAGSVVREGDETILANERAPLTWLAFRATDYTRQSCTTAYPQNGGHLSSGGESKSQLLFAPAFEPNDTAESVCSKWSTHSK